MENLDPTRITILSIRTRNFTSKTETQLLLLGAFVFIVALIIPRTSLVKICMGFGSRAIVKDEEAAFWRKQGIEVKPDQRTFITFHPRGTPLDDIQAYKSNLIVTKRFKRNIVELRPVQMNINKTDVLVVLHIQKTGGTSFENMLSENIVIEPPTTCSEMWDVKGRIACKCYNDKGQDWQFNRANVGWPCGIHASFQDIATCVDRWYSSQPGESRHRDYHYVTLIRDPVVRFFSEWLHTRRGATWKESRWFCDGRGPSLEELPFCFQGGTWEGVSLEEFLDCPHNLAFNRQTRMLANLSLSDCFRLDSNKSQEERNEIMLKSAKENLAHKFKYFGIIEFLQESHELFKKTFRGIEFKANFTCKFGSPKSKVAFLSNEIWTKILNLNLLDVRLYQYAKDLLLQRLEASGVELRSGRNFLPRRVNKGFTYITFNA